MLLSDTTRTWHFNLLPVTSLLTQGDFSRAPILLLVKNNIKSCSHTLTQGGNNRGRSGGEKGPVTGAVTEQRECCFTCKALQPSIGPQHSSCSPSSLQTSGSYHCCSCADRAKDLFSNTSPQRAMFKRSETREQLPGDHKGRLYSLLN